MGLAQRLEHTHCSKVVIGVSGGLDSTLALIVLVRTFDMLGLDRKGIIGVTMPGFGTTDRTYQNALTMVKELGCTLREISIREACEQHNERRRVVEEYHRRADERAAKVRNIISTEVLREGSVAR